MFYCGLMAHNALVGQVIEGKQEKLISKDIFLKVNDLLSINKHGYGCNMDGELTPLKRFIKCDCCGEPMRGYQVLKKGLNYYKCNTKTCKNNKSSKEIHAIFEAVLEKLSLAPTIEIKALVAKQMIADYNRATSEKRSDREAIRRQIQEITQKADRLEERLINEEITLELYQKYTAKFKADKAELERGLFESGNEMSNLEKCVNKLIGFALKLAPVWRLMPYKEKMLFQKMVFPEGITYNKEKDQCRTTKINSVFLYFTHLAGTLEAIKKGIPKFFFDIPDWVPGAGVEPAYP